MLILLLVTIIGMATLQILLRNLFGTGLVWNESFLRVLLLWITLVGTMIATRKAEHIQIDLLQRYLKTAQSLWVGRFVSLSAAVICAIFAWYGGVFVWIEYQNPSLAFANVPHWVCVIIIPFGFAVIAWRFFWQTFFPVTRPDDA